MNGSRPASHWHDLFGSDRESLPVAGQAWRDRRQAMVDTAAQTGHRLTAAPEILASPRFIETLAQRSAELDTPVRASVELGDLHQEFGPNTIGGPQPTDGTLSYDLVVGSSDRPAQPVVVDQMAVAARAPQPGRMARPITSFAGDRFIWAVDHWFDLLVVNQLALQARAAGLETLVDPAAEVHPTAVVEDSIVGPGATVGPYAVVRRSEIGAGTVVDEHASIRGSIIGPATIVQTQALVHSSVVGPETVISFQTAIRGSVLFGRSTISAPVVARSVIGPETFLARGVSISATTLLDAPIPVRIGSRAVDTGARLLGCAIGRGARIGNGITIPAGYTVPPGSYLVERPLPRIPDNTDPTSLLLLDGGRFRPLPTLKGARS